MYIERQKLVAVGLYVSVLVIERAQGGSKDQLIEVAFLLGIFLANILFYETVILCASVGYWERRASDSGKPQESAFLFFFWMLFLGTACGYVFNISVY